MPGPKDGSQADEMCDLEIHVLDTGELGYRVSKKHRTAHSPLGPMLATRKRLADHLKLNYRDSYLK